MNIRSVLCLCCAVLMLSSCALQEGNEAQQSETDNKVMTVDESEVKVNEISKLYDGWEELQGKKVGKNIIMPDKLEPQTVGKIYTFNFEKTSDYNDLENKGKEFFKRFFGDLFDEEYTHLYEFETGEKAFAYNSEDPHTPGVKHDDKHPYLYGYFEGYPSIATKILYEWYPQYSKELIAHYDPEKDKDTVLKLENGECTVKESCEAVKSFIETEYPSFGAFELRPVFLNEYTSNGNKHLVSVQCALFLDDAPINYYFPAYNSTENVSKNDLTGTAQTYYSPYYVSFVLDGKDSIIDVRASQYPVKEVSVTEQTKLLSLKDAAELLGNNLAENFEIKLTKVSLGYFRKTTTYAYWDKDLKLAESSLEFRDFRPVWSFEWESNEDGIGCSSFNVDAISGEITIAGDTSKLSNKGVPAGSDTQSDQENKQ